MSLLRQRMLQLLLLLLLMVVAPGKSMESSGESSRWDHPQTFIQYRVALPSYPDFISRMDYYLIETSSKYVVRDHFIARDHFILSKQQNGKPVGWKMIQLLGLGDFNTTLAIRDDNLYIIGFANRTGHWHVFPKYKELIPGATVLDFGEDYPSLVKGGRWGLKKLPLGLKATLDSVEVLSEYNKFRNGGNNATARKAVATLSVTICEAARFNDIYKRIQSGWFTGTHINGWHAILVVHWRIISCALLNWQKTGKWGTDGTPDDEAEILKEMLGIFTPERALRIINVLIWPKPMTCHWPVLDE